MARKKLLLGERLKRIQQRELTDDEKRQQAAKRKILEEWVTSDTEKRLQVTGGQDCHYAENFVLLNATGYTMPELDDMPCDEADALRDAYLRYREKSNAATVTLNEEANRLLNSMLSFEVGERVSAEKLFQRDEMAFRGGVTDASIATRLKRLRKTLPRDTYQFRVHESGGCGFTWIKKPKS